MRTLNNAEVKKQLEEHVLNYFDSFDEFVEQTLVFRRMPRVPSNWHAGFELARNGFMMVYYNEVDRLFKELDVPLYDNNVRNWDRYCNAVGRAVERLMKKANVDYTKLELIK